MIRQDQPATDGDRRLYEVEMKEGRCEKDESCARFTVADDLEAEGTQERKSRGRRGRCIAGIG